MRNDYRPDIDGIRTVAVLSVLLYHLGFQKFAGGFVGVDVFFVISGYLITGLISRELAETGSFRFGHFYLRRIRRLFPAAFMIFVVTFVFAFLLMAPQHFSDFGMSLVASVLSFSNVYFWIKANYFDLGNQFRPLLHTWSLSVEEQFYLAWPLLLWGWYKVAGGRSTGILVAILFVVSLVLNWRYEQDQTTIFYLPWFRVFEFAIGAAVLRLPVARNWMAEVAVVAGLLLIAYAVLFYDEQMVFPSTAALAPCLGAALAIWGGRAAVAGKLLSNPIAVHVGLISYSLYLVHWPLIVLYRYFVFHEIGTAEKVGLLIASVLLAELSYQLVEKPTRKGAGVRPKVFVATCITCAAAIVFPAWATSAQAGWIWRIPVERQELALRGGGGFHLTNYGGVNCTQVECNFGGEPTDFVLIGDSHGRMYHEGFAIYAKARALAFNTYENGACNFLSVRSLCPAKIKAIPYLKEGGADTAILSESWMRDNYEALIFQRPLSELRRDPGEFARYYRGQIEKELKSGYLAKTKRLIVIGEVPQFGGFGDPFICMTRPTYLQSGKNCAVAIISKNTRMQLFMEFNRYFAAELERTKVSRHEITFLDPFAALCNGGACTQIENGALIYSDADHLSKFGAEKAVRAFAPTLDKVLLQKDPSVGDRPL